MLGIAVKATAIVPTSTAGISFRRAVAELDFPGAVTNDTINFELEQNNALTVSFLKLLILVKFKQ
jgi:hypothetical protein